MNREEYQAIIADEITKFGEHPEKVRVLEIVVKHDRGAAQEVKAGTWISLSKLTLPALKEIHNFLIGRHKE